MIVLLGVLLVVLGFATRRNPLLVVAVAGIATGLLGHLSPREVLAAFGEGFASSRSVTIFAVTLPVIGLLERYGLQEQARTLISRFAKLTAGRFLALYLGMRQIGAAVGLTNVFGHAQTVRPLAVPMAEGAAERSHGSLPARARERIRAYAASADNVGLFFGEDIFLAVGSILLIASFVNTTYHTHLEPLQLAVWAVPSALCAFLLHGWRMLRMDRYLAREAAAASARPSTGPAPEGPAADGEVAK
ncbi:DUF969 domain-containing protein [Streptomyces sp. NPDC059740]|uniref:DUF969 domain-containing protein n=1 Tax=Streptomyces sp. NPDC059740 TaxID=3346926 RepID=UPI0036552E48